MKTTQLTDSLTQLTRFGMVNAYLVREEDGFTLVDTMLSKSTDGILTAARKQHVRIVRIALTHCHGDHVGSLDDLVANLGTQAEVLAPERDARIMAGDRTLSAEEAAHGKLKGSWPAVKTTPGVLLSPGDRVGSLEVVATPGTPPVTSPSSTPATAA